MANPETPPGSPTDAQLAQRNLIAFNRALTRWGSRGRLEEDGGAVLCAGGTWIPVVANGAFRSDDTLGGADLIARADAFFESLARGFSVKVRDSGDDDDLRSACVAAGLDAFGEATPEMICVAPLPDLAPPAGLTVRWVDDVAGVADFTAVNAQAYGTYGMPGEVLGDLFDETAQLLSDDTAHVVVARRGDEPVATAMTFESDGVASLQWVGTRPRRQGRRARRVRHDARHQPGVRRGASSCSLQASPMGGADLPRPRLRDDLPLRRVRPLAAPTGALRSALRSLAVAQKPSCPRA